MAHYDQPDTSPGYALLDHKRPPAAVSYLRRVEALEALYVCVAARHRDGFLLPGSVLAALDRIDQGARGEKGKKLT